MDYKAIAFVAVFFLIGCSGQCPVDTKQTLLKVNNYVVTPDEFEREFADSPYAHSNTLDSRKQFLEILINRKLILQEAERKGLDKQAEFLRNIERFWEQALLKATLDYKGREVSGRVHVTDAAVEEEYKRLQAEGKAEKPLSDMYNQIKWELIRAKEAQLLDEWLKFLRDSAVIKENLDLLNDK